MITQCSMCQVVLVNSFTQIHGYSNYIIYNRPSVQRSFCSYLQSFVQAMWIYFVVTLLLATETVWTMAAFSALSLSGSYFPPLM